MILAGDVGGTKTNLGWFHVEGDRVKTVRAGHFSNREYGSCEALIESFLATDRHPVESFCLGVAGPVLSGAVEATNLPWRLSERELGDRLGLPAPTLINDLVATAEGIPALSEDEVVVLEEGAPRPCAVQLVVAAGTGFGAALRVPVDGRMLVLPSEAGHMEYAATAGPMAELADAVRERHGRATIERIVSGPGLVDAYELAASSAPHDPDEAFARRWRDEDRGKLITEYALERGSERASRVLDLFVSALGQVVGDLALSVLALGGVWIGGGIAPAIESKLREATFREAFVAKGRMREIVERVPVRLVRNRRTAMLGAARRAARVVLADAAS